MHDEHQGRVRDERDRREVLERVVGKPLVHRRVDRVSGHVLEPDGVAVGRRLRDEIGGERRSGAGLVLDDDLLSDRRGDLRRQRSSEDVGDAAGGEAQDQPNGLRGVRVLRAGRGCDEGPDDDKVAIRLRRIGFIFPPQGLPTPDIDLLPSARGVDKYSSCGPRRASSLRLGNSGRVRRRPCQSSRYLIKFSTLALSPPDAPASTLDGRWAPVAGMCASELLFPQPEEEI